MKKPILRVLISAILFSLISGIVISIAGLRLGWKTSTQFSDGFFWVGAILIGIGLWSIQGAHSERPVFGLQYSQSAIEGRFKLWAADISHGYNLMAFFGITGLLLLGMSGLAILVGGLF
jgi:hypothetical protein